MSVVTPNAQFRTLNYGQAVQAGQQISYNRLRNETIGMENEKAQDMLRKRKQAEEIRSHFDKMPEQIDALEKAKLFDEADKLRDTFIKTRKAEVEVIGAMRKGINKENYKDVRSQMLQSGMITPGMWPEEYDDKWFIDQEKTKKATITSYTRHWTQQGSTGVWSQDVEQQGGDIKREGAPYQDPKLQGGYGKGKGAGSDATKAADSNSIRAGVAQYYGGTYDPQTGRFSGLDKTLTTKVLEASAEAENIYEQSDRKIGHDVAIARALRKYGHVVKDPEDPTANDPARIRKPKK
jgi:hypothetical protein